MAIAIKPKEAAAGPLIHPSKPGYRSLVEQTVPKAGKRSSAKPQAQKSKPKTVEKPAKPALSAPKTIETIVAKLAEKRPEKELVSLRLDAKELAKFQAAVGPRWRAVLIMMVDDMIRQSLQVVKP